MSDTLSRVLLSADAVARWIDLTREAAASLSAHGVRHAEDLPEELAREEPDGGLTVYVPLPDGSEVAMRCAPHEWAWAKAGERNQ